MRESVFGRKPASALLIQLLLATAFGLPVFHVQATVVLTNLYSFTGGRDGGAIDTGLVQGSDGNLYGTTEFGGTYTNGTVFKITTNGALTSLYSFGGGHDGAHPRAGVVQGGDGYFYGTTSDGGTDGNGTVFKISTNGTLTTLYSFFGANDGADPVAGLVQGSDGYFYGTTSGGGTDGNGTVFKISTNGTLTTLYSFVGANDGADPAAGLVQGIDGYFYGTTSDGYLGALPHKYGTVFKISTNGSLTTLYSFSGTNDGAYPLSGLVQGSDRYLYGTTYGGGTNGSGTVFKISTGGSLITLYSFGSVLGTNGIPFDGSNPVAGLVQGNDGCLYGTTEGNWFSYVNGTVFRISTNGEYRTLYSFGDGNDGTGPDGLVQGSDGNFYGTTEGGTVFRLTVMRSAPAFQAVTLTGGALNLIWNTESGGKYQLQYSSDLRSNNWTNLANAVTATGSILTAADSIRSNPQRFYRVVALP